LTLVLLLLVVALAAAPTGSIEEIRTLGSTRSINTFLCCLNLSSSSLLSSWSKLESSLVMEKYSDESEEKMDDEEVAEVRLSPVLSPSGRRSTRASPRLSSESPKRAAPPTMTVSLPTVGAIAVGPAAQEEERRR
jgi:hypothetical protein